MRKNSKAEDDYNKAIVVAYQLYYTYVSKISFTDFETKVLRGDFQEVKNDK